MKTCYISDLDGTLLGKNVKLSDYTADRLSEMLSSGLNFTVATARSPYSVKSIFEGVSIILPMILMNGVMLYDLSSDEIVSYAGIPEECSERIISEMRAEGLTAFVYEINDQTLCVSYEDVSEPQMYEFYKERLDKYGKRFEMVPRLEDIDKREIVYYTLLYSRDVLTPLYDRLQGLEGISCSFYNDIYSDMWYLEIFSDMGTKYNGAKYIREHCGFDRLVAFGDSENDISLFEACDVKCAVDNACQTLKDMADVIIGNNECDSVINYILGDK